VAKEQRKVIEKYRNETDSVEKNNSISSDNRKAVIIKKFYPCFEFI
jgi:hypothetical protein